MDDKELLADWFCPLIRDACKGEKCRFHTTFIDPHGRSRNTCAVTCISDRLNQYMGAQMEIMHKTGMVE